MHCDISTISGCTAGSSDQNSYATQLLTSHLTARRSRQSIDHHWQAPLRWKSGAAPSDSLVRVSHEPACLMQRENRRQFSETFLDLLKSKRHFRSRWPIATCILCGAGGLPTAEAGRHSRLPVPVPAYPPPWRPQERRHHRRPLRPQRLFRPQSLPQRWPRVPLRRRLRPQPSSQPQPSGPS